MPGSHTARPAPTVFQLLLPVAGSGRRALQEPEHRLRGVLARCGHAALWLRAGWLPDADSAAEFQLAVAPCSDPPALAAALLEAFGPDAALAVSHTVDVGRPKDAN